MKLGDLKKIIDETLAYTPHAKDCEVTILIKGEGGIGATPCVGVRSAGKGFDWDGHMFMMYPETPLYKNPQKIVKMQKK